MRNNNSLWSESVMQNKKKYGLIFLSYIHVHEKGRLRDGDGLKIVLNISNA